MGPDLRVVKTFGDPADARTLEVKLKKAGLRYVEIRKDPGSKYGMGFEVEYSVMVPATELVKALEILNK
jgi:hypothetical protein